MVGKTTRQRRSRADQSTPFDQEDSRALSNLRETAMPLLEQVSLFPVVGCNTIILSHYN